MKTKWQTVRVNAVWPHEPPSPCLLTQVWTDPTRPDAHLPDSGGPAPGFKYWVVGPVGWWYAGECLTMGSLRLGLSGRLSGTEPACNAGDVGSIPGSGRAPGEGNGNPLQYSCQENPTDRRARRDIVHGVVKSWTRFSDLTATPRRKLGSWLLAALLTSMTDTSPAWPWRHQAWGWEGTYSSTRSTEQQMQILTKEEMTV